MKYAQTSFQLYQQLAALGYGVEDRETVARAYQFIFPLFSANYRACGRPFICHLVGTASILASQRTTAQIIVAGLAHAVYMVGDFGFDAGQRQSMRKRRQVRSVLGEDVEAIVAKYDSITRGMKPQEILATLDSNDIEKKHAMKLYLANTLEDLIEGDLAYARRDKSIRYQALEAQKCLLLSCREIGWEAASETMAEAFDRLNSGVVPVDRSLVQAGSRVVLPASARRKFMPVIRGGIARRLARWRRAH